VEEKIYLDNLSDYAVSIRKQKIYIESGVEYPVGNPWRKAYINTEIGRAELLADKNSGFIPAQYYDSIVKVWGNTVYPEPAM
jgi:hypothetical protein